MPATYTVRQKRARQFSYSATGGKLQVRRQIVYHVFVTGVDPATVGEPDVISAAGLPIANYSTYEFQGKIIPYLICKQKSAKQDGKVLASWEVTCDYDSDPRSGGEDTPQEPADPDTIAPKVETSTETIDWVVWKDRSGNPLLTPTGNFYAEPFTVPVPLTVLAITQYELTWSDDNIAARVCKANSDVYRSKAAYTWRTFDVRATPTIVNEIPCHQVSYVVKHNPMPDGWKETRALVDTHYLSSGKQVPFRDREGNPRLGFINADGTPRTLASGAITTSMELLGQTSFTFLQA